MDDLIKNYDELRKTVTKGTDKAAHHILQDAEMYSIIENYRKGIGMAMPVLGNRGQRLTPHWILNRFQDVHGKKGSGSNIVDVARWGLIAGGCRKSDADEIVEFVQESMDIVDYFTKG